MSQRLKTDWILFSTVLVMISFGMVILYSASSIMARLDPRFGSSWHFVIRQLGWAVAAIAVMMTLKKTNYRKFNNSAVAFTAIGVALMLLGAVYFVDAAHHRWLRLGGPFGVQPSELAKPALVVFMAFFVTWRARAINNPRHTLHSGGAGGGPGDLCGGGARPRNRRGPGRCRDGGVLRRRPAVAVLLHRRGHRPAGTDCLHLRRTLSPGPRGEVLRPRVQDRRPLRPAGRRQSPDAAHAADERHQLPVAAIEDRGGRRRSAGPWPDERKTEAALPAGSPYGFHLRRGGRGTRIIGLGGPADRLRHYFLARPAGHLPDDRRIRAISGPGRDGGGGSAGLYQYERGARHDADQGNPACR